MSDTKQIIFIHKTENLEPKFLNPKTKSPRDS